MSLVELFSNLVWVAVCAALLLAGRAAMRRSEVRIPLPAALIVIALLCLILLPAISLSDDALAANQADLPVAAQTWRLAVEGSTLAIDLLLAVALPLALLFLDAFGSGESIAAASIRGARQQARWLTRSQRLRPPLPISV